MLKRQVNRFRITCSNGFWLVLAILLYLDGQNLVFLTALACVLHEMGHWITLRFCGGRMSMVRLTAIGVEMKLDPDYPISYPQEIASILAGPAVNLLLAWISAKNNRYSFAGLNLSLGLLNLFPVLPLDGGRALACALSIRWPQAADMILEILSITITGALFGLGLAAWRRGENLTLLLVSVWMLFRSTKRRFS